MREKSRLRRPVAVLPVLMSLAGLALVLEHYVRTGGAHEPDEVTEAHLFQVLMLLEVPMIGYFILSSLPRFGRSMLAVLALQALMAAAAFTSVYFLT